MPEKVQLVIVGEDAELDIPPPKTPVLPEKKQLVIVGEEPMLFIPPAVPAALPVPMVVKLPPVMINPSNVAEAVSPLLLFKITLVPLPCSVALLARFL